MGKKPYAAIGGFGVGLVMWILERADVAMPLWSLVLLGAVALGMIVFGSIPIVVRAYHGIQRVKLRTPFVTVHPGVTKDSQKQLTQEMIVKEYSPHVRETLDALIKRGEELTHQMQRDDFHRGQLGQEVRQWLDSVEHDVWEIMPEHANLLTTNQRSTQETFTDQERLRYGGWNRNAAALRVSVDRKLLHLREIRSQIQNRGKGSMVKPQASPEIQKLADQMTKAIQRDIYDFTSCIFVHNTKIDWQHLVDTDSYFEIHCDIYSSSVFEIDIGGSADGHIRYEDAELERPIEVRTPIKKLRRTNIEHLVLRQWISQSMMNRIALDGGNEVRLFLNGINIWVEAKQLDSYETPKCRLPIPHEFSVRIPTQVELEKQ